MPAPSTAERSRNHHQNVMAGTYVKTTARGHGRQSGRRTDCSARPPTDPDIQDYCIRLLTHHHSQPILLSLCRACLVRPFVGSSPSGRSAHGAMMPGFPFPTVAPLGLGSPPTRGTTGHSDVCFLFRPPPVVPCWPIPCGSLVFSVWPGGGNSPDPTRTIFDVPARPSCWTGLLHAWSPQTSQVSDSPL